MLGIGFGITSSYAKGKAHGFVVPGPIQITCLLDIDAVLEGLAAGQSPGAVIDPAFYDLSTYVTNAPNASIADVQVQFFIDGQSGFDGSAPVDEFDEIGLALVVIDTANNTAVFTSPTVVVGPALSQLHRFVLNPDYTVSIDWNGADFDLAVTQPARLASTVHVAAADLTNGPIIAAGPGYSGVAEVGSTVEIVNWLVLNDAANSPPALSYAHDSNGTLLPGATNALYSVGMSVAGTALTGHLTASEESGSTSALTTPVAVPMPAIVTNLLSKTDDMTATVWSPDTGLVVLNASTLLSQTAGHLGLRQTVAGMTKDARYVLQFKVGYLGPNAPWVRIKGGGAGRHTDFRIDGTPNAVSGANATATIEALGGGEYLCAVHFPAQYGTNTISISPMANGTGTAATNGQISVRNAQLTAGDTLTLYTPGA